MNYELQAVQKFQADFDAAHEGAVPFLERISAENPEALEHLVVCLAGEVGELANIAKKIRRGDAPYSESLEKIIDETSDIFAYLLKVANQVGFDLGSAYYKKMERNKTRFAGFEK